MSSTVRRLLLGAVLCWSTWACAAAVRQSAPAKRTALVSPAPGFRVPLLEGRDGIVGAPRDETAFEFEIERSKAYDEPAVVQGASPPPVDIKRTLAAYLDARRAKLASVSATGELLVLTRLAETTQAHRVATPLGQREQVTFGSEPVQQASFVPNAPHLVTYRLDTSGNEDYQVLLVDLETRSLRLLSDGRSRHGPFRWSSKSSQLAFTKLHGEVDADFVLTSRDDFASKSLMTLPGQWLIANWSRDETQLLVQEYIASTETRLHLLDIGTKGMRPLSGPEENVSYGAAGFTPNGKSILTLSNRESDTTQLWRHDVHDATWHKLTNHTWDVEEFTQSSDGTRVAYVLNVDGYSELHSLELTSGSGRRISEIPAGVISGIRFQTRKKLLFSLTTPTSPMDVFSFDLELGQLTRWTRSEIGGLPETAFVDARLVKFRSFDDLPISAFLYEPPGTGPFPTLIWVHGGPEGQSRPAFDPIIQYFAGRLGIAVIAPNIRGSSGYGKRFLGLDDGVHRFDSIRDVGAVLDFIEREPKLEARRVGIHGASYGGYVVLASLVEYGERIAAGSDMVGISNFVSFLENTSSYRREIRRKEYGDEREPAMREYLQAISPLTHAERIKSALFVAHGANDPRVPVSEAEALVERVRAAGHPAWFMLARSDGHTFRKRENRDQFYELMATFFAANLLGNATPALEQFGVLGKHDVPQLQDGLPAPSADKPAL